MKYEPNGVITQCQCVMQHSTLAENAIPQCDRRRSKDSNLFCKLCEETHGNYWRKKHPEAVEK